MPQDDVPPGPYFHGTRALLQPGDVLKTDFVDVDDDREMCWASTTIECAFKWAARPGRGSVLYVYEVDLVDPERDPNYEEPEGSVPVMGSSGRVVRLVEKRDASDGPRRRAGDSEAASAAPDDSTRTEP